MRRRQLIAQIPQVKPLSLRERLYEACKEEKRCVICQHEISLGIRKHFDSCWLNLSKYLGTT
jgi:hypothetical protein